MSSSRAFLGSWVALFNMVPTGMATPPTWTVVAPSFAAIAEYCVYDLYDANKGKAVVIPTLVVVSMYD